MSPSIGFDLPAAVKVEAKGDEDRGLALSGASFRKCRVIALLVPKQRKAAVHGFQLIVQDNTGSTWVVRRTFEEMQNFRSLLIAHFETHCAHRCKGLCGYVTSTNLLLPPKLPWFLAKSKLAFSKMRLTTIWEFWDHLGRFTTSQRFFNCAIATGYTMALLHEFLRAPKSSFTSILHPSIAKLEVSTSAYLLVDRIRVGTGHAASRNVSTCPEGCTFCHNKKKTIHNAADEEIYGKIVRLYCNHTSHQFCLLQTLTAADPYRGANCADCGKKISSAVLASVPLFDPYVNGQAPPMTRERRPRDSSLDSLLDRSEERQTVGHEDDPLDVAEYVYEIRDEEMLNRELRLS